MQDLNDKVTGGTLTAAEWNEVPSEIQNVIEGLGITLSGADLNQLGKAISGYVANGDFYTDSGIVNAYVLTTIGSKQSPTAYTDGMRVSFIPGNTSTGATTVNVAGLGVKSVQTENSTVLPSGALPTNLNADLRFSVSADAFFLMNATHRALKGPPVNDASIVGYAFEIDGDTGFFAEGGVDLSGSDLLLRVDGADVGKFTTSDKSLVTSGFTKLPSGAILQWGEFTQADNGGILAFTFNLPLTFPNAGLQALITPKNNLSATVAYTAEVTSTTQVTGFTIGTTVSRTYRIFVIGH